MLYRGNDKVPIKKTIKFLTKISAVYHDSYRSKKDGSSLMEDLTSLIKYAAMQYFKTRLNIVH